MNIRKCATLLAVAVSLCAVSAENSSYASHLTTAKAYEAKKQWVAALSEYYEAMLAEPTLAAQEAYHGWTALADDIKSGKPGHGTFDVFELYDGWIAFMQEYERYWTEHCPRVIIFDMPKRTEINTANRTATYTVGVSWRWSEKYTAMYDVITEGYKKAYTSQWNASYLKDWSERSVYNAPANKGKFLQNGAVQTQNRTTSTLVTHTNYGPKTFTLYTYENVIAESGPLYTRPAFSANIPYVDKTTSKSVTLIGNTGYTTMYDIQFNLITFDKKTIFQSPRTLVSSNSTCTFTATAEQMKYLDAGKIAFAPVALYLKYGEQPTNVDIVPNSRAWMNNLPEVQVSLTKTPFDVKSKSTDDPDKNTFAVNVIGKLVKTAKIMEQKWNEICGTILSKQNSLFTKGTTTARTIASYTFDYESREYQPFAELRTKLTAKYGAEKYAQVKLYMLCNTLSIAENLSTAYSVNGINKDSYAEEMEFLLANYDKISCNADANGYRAPTAGEAALYKDVEGRGIIIVRAASAEEKQQQQIITEQKWNKNCDDILLNKNAVFTKGTVSAWTIASYTFDYESRGYQPFAELRTKLAAEYGEEKYEQVKLYMLCNALSKAENLTSAYSVDGANKNSYAEEMEFFLTNYDKISCDPSASGYRAPTAEEASLFADLVNRGGKIIVRPASDEEKQ